MREYNCEPYVEPDHFCLRCEEQEIVSRHAGESFESIVSILYGKEKFNSGMLDCLLDELGKYLHVKVPSTELKVKGVEENE